MTGELERHVGRARMGDVDAYGQVVAHMQNMAVGYAYSLLCNIHDAEDAAQEAFICAFRHLGELRDTAAFPGWFRRIVFSSCTRAMRKRRGCEVPIDEADRVAGLAGDPVLAAEQTELSVRIQDAIGHLPEAQREAFILFHIGDLSYRQVAEFLGVSQSAVTNRLYAARRSVRRELGDIMAEHIKSLRVSTDDEFKKKVILGVPRVFYGQQDGRWEITPFPSCLRACLKSFGGRVDYPFLLCASGAAFRLMWHPGIWDGGNVDILCMDADPLVPIRRAFHAVGYTVEAFANASWKTPLPHGSVHEAAGRFGHFLDEGQMKVRIRTSIDAGVPVLALGVVGPLECCILTGYDEAGEVLMGWSFFQDFECEHPSKDSDPNGYFRKRAWFRSTTGIMLFGESVEPPSELELLPGMLRYALTVMQTKTVGERVGGFGAFDAWAEDARKGAGLFPQDTDLAFTRMMAFGDAMDMVMEGRSYAAEYLRTVAPKTQVAEELTTAAACFEEVVGHLHEVGQVLGGLGRGPQQTAALGDPATQERLAPLILAARDDDRKAAGHLERALAKLEGAVPRPQ